MSYKYHEVVGVREGGPNSETLMFGQEPGPCPEDYEEIPIDGGEEDDDA